MIASNTKAMTTLLLAKLVGEHRITWDTRVTTVPGELGFEFVSAREPRER